MEFTGHFKPICKAERDTREGVAEISLAEPWGHFVNVAAEECDGAHGRDIWA